MTVPLRQDRPHLRFGQDRRHPRWALRALDVVELFECPPEDLVVEEHDSAKRLILSRSRYVSLDPKVGQKALDLGFAHGVRMALPMEQDEPGLQGCGAFGGYRMNPFYPLHIGLLGAGAIMLQAQTLVDPVQESGLGVIGVRHKQTKGSDA